MTRIGYDLKLLRGEEIVGKLTIDGVSSESRRGRLDLGAAKALLAGEGAELSQMDTPDEAALREFGTKLYELAFPHPVCCHFEERVWPLIEHSPEGEAQLALSLWLHRELDASVLALPWELIYLQCGETFLATDPRVALSRSYADWINRARPAASADAALRILLIRCQPKEPELGAIASLSLVNRLGEIAAQTGRLELLPILADCRPKAIADALDAQRPDIVHLLAHGRFADDQTEFALCDPGTGRAIWFADRRLANLIKPYPPRLVLLHACEGARGSPMRSFANGAAWLVKARLPAVLAMQYPITNDVASRFANALYLRIANGDDLDQAVQSARAKLSNEQPEAPEGRIIRDSTAATLWMHPDARRLFTEPVEPQPETTPPMDTEITVLVETPDDAGLEADVSSETLVEEIIDAVLDAWRPPLDLAERPHRYQLFRDVSDSAPLQRRSSLSELAGPTAKVLRLRLVPEPLEPNSPVSLLIEDERGERYRTQVLMSTRLGDLAGEFLHERGISAEPGRVAIDLLGAWGAPPRSLDFNQTLYEAAIGDDAHLRVIPKSSHVQGVSG